MSSTPLICSSSGVATVSEMTRGLAPGNCARTTTCGGATSGYSEIGSWKIASSPTRKMKIDSTAAKRGRSMKKREMSMQRLLSALGDRLLLLLRRRAGRAAGRRHDRHALGVRPAATCGATVMPGWMRCKPSRTRRARRALTLPCTTRMPSARAPRCTSRNCGLPSLPRRRRRTSSSDRSRWARSGTRTALYAAALSMRRRTLSPGVKRPAGLSNVPAGEPRRSAD